MRRKILEDLGGFDEDLPAAEDYDLWLRITSRHPVCLIPIPLITKRGGHPDQLSKTVANLDKYRIKALVNILSGQTPRYSQGKVNDENTIPPLQILSPDKRQAAWSELVKKCRIYGHGCRKHGRFKEASYYLSLPQKILDMVM